MYSCEWSENNFCAGDNMRMHTCVQCDQCECYKHARCVCVHTAIPPVAHENVTIFVRATDASAMTADIRACATIVLGQVS